MGWGVDRGVRCGGIRWCDRPTGERGAHRSCNPGAVRRGVGFRGGCWKSIGAFAGHVREVEDGKGAWESGATVSGPCWAVAVLDPSDLRSAFRLGEWIVQS